MRREARKEAEAKRPVKQPDSIRLVGPRWNICEPQPAKTDVKQGSLRTTKPMTILYIYIQMSHAHWCPVCRTQGTSTGTKVPRNIYRTCAKKAALTRLSKLMPSQVF